MDPDLTWVGPCYESEGLSGRRLLIVAEAFPSEEGAGLRVGRGLEAHLTPSYVDGSMKHKQFTDLARVVLGGAADRSACEEFWNVVAFSNLIVPSGGTSRRPSPTEDDWDRARVAFPELVIELEPDAVLIVGVHLAQVLSTVVEEEGADAPQAVARIPHPATPGFAFRDHVAAARHLRQR